MKPEISICIPNYNNEKYLEQSILSAINQDYKNVEIIFVDDCSTDNSFLIAKKYSNKINIYQNEQNLGQAKNTNKAISLAKADFVVILHSDDQLLKNFCSTLLPLIKNNPNVVMAVGERQETDETNEIERITPFYNTDCLIPGEKQAKVFMMMSFLPCQVLFRKKTFFESGLVNERHIINLDGLLWFQLSLLGDVSYTRKDVSIYRMHQENTTSTYNKTLNHMLEYYITLSEMFKLAKGRKYLEQYFNDAEKRVGTLTLRYLTDVLRKKDYPLAKQYLKLAEVFNKDIIYNDEYIKINSMINTSNKEIDDKEIDEYINSLNKRDFSYKPPEGSILRSNYEPSNIK